MENASNQNQRFNFGTFIEESKKALLSPKDHFSSMPTSGGFVEPLIKVLIYGAIMGVFSFIWLSTGMQFSSGISFLGSGIEIMAFIGSILFAIIGLFLGGDYNAGYLCNSWRKYRLRSECSRCGISNGY